MTNEEYQALVDVLHSIRPDWGKPGIFAALHRASNRTDRPSSQQIHDAALAAAENTNVRTPAVIALDGPHWRTTPAATNGERWPSGPLPECVYCGQPAKRYDVEGEGPGRKVTPHPPPKFCPDCGAPWKSKIVKVTGQDLHATQTCQACGHTQLGGFHHCSNCGAEITIPEPVPVAARPHLDDPIPVAETIWDTLDQIHERQARATQEPWPTEETP